MKYHLGERHAPIWLAASCLLTPEEYVFISFSYVNQLFTVAVWCFNRTTKLVCTSLRMPLETLGNKPASFRFILQSLSVWGFVLTFQASSPDELRRIAALDNDADARMRKVDFAHNFENTCVEHFRTRSGWLVKKKLAAEIGARTDRFGHSRLYRSTFASHCWFKVTSGTWVLDSTGEMHVRQMMKTCSFSFWGGKKWQMWQWWMTFSHVYSKF